MAPQREVLVRTGTHPGHRAGRGLGGGTTRRLIEAEIPAEGALAVQVNRQPVRRRSDLAGVLNVTVFAPDDLHLVQGGPSPGAASTSTTCWWHVTQLAWRSSHRVDPHPAPAGGGAAPGPGARGPTIPWPPPSTCVGRAAGPSRGRSWPRSVAELAAEGLSPAGLGEPTSDLAGVAHSVTLEYRRSWEGGLARTRWWRPRRGRRPTPGHVGRDRTATTSTIGHLHTTRPAPTPPRANSAAWRWPCAWPPTSCAGATWPSPGPAPRRRLLRARRQARSAALVALLPPGQVLLTTAVDPPPDGPRRAGGRGHRRCPRRRPWGARDRPRPPPPAAASATAGAA